MHAMMVIMHWAWLPWVFRSAQVSLQALPILFLAVSFDLAALSSARHCATVTLAIGRILHHAFGSKPKQKHRAHHRRAVEAQKVLDGHADVVQAAGLHSIPWQCEGALIRGLGHGGQQVGRQQLLGSDAEAELK